MDRELGDGPQRENRTPPLARVKGVGRQQQQRERGREENERDERDNVHFWNKFTCFLFVFILFCFLCIFLYFLCIVICMHNFYSAHIFIVYNSVICNSSHSIFYNGHILYSPFCVHSTELVCLYKLDIGL